MNIEKTLEKKVKVAWSCPSNIAIIKYWGKHAKQIPCNASISLTLSNSSTRVEADLVEKTTTDSVQLAYYFEEKRNLDFERRVTQFLEDNILYFPYLTDYGLVIHSINTFPHSAGIASSASAFGAIALALLELSYSHRGQIIDGEFYELASYLARLGSGSASRSLFPGFVLWGENENKRNSSNLHAVPIASIHPNFQAMKDAILIVEDQPKKVSSSVGHALMNNHPFAKQRFQQADARVSVLMDVLKNGDWDKFIAICESEALTLHAMMMTSKEYYLLMKPGTLQIIEKLFAFREQSKIPVCFTLDAGPNVHVLYPASYQVEVERFIKENLTDSYKKAIFDMQGNGPQKLL